MDPTRTAPSVGIFWLMPGDDRMPALVTDATSLNEAEPYGDALTHPRGHYEIWEIWQALGPAGLRRRGLPTTIAEREYEEFPRGRVIYMRADDCFTIYADRRLQHPDTIERIVHAFGLDQHGHIVRSDAHYRSRA